MACADVCPKELPLLDVYAYLRRKSLGAKFVSEN
jgi:succinate dehydrogenase/fumarate reductase-like Fe-S protein